MSRPNFLFFDAAPGERNDVVVSVRAGSVIDIADRSGPLEGRAGCTQVDVRRTRLARKTYMLAPGRAARVRMPLTRRGQRLLRNRSDESRRPVHRQGQLRGSQDAAGRAPGALTAVPC